jgi:hypothetical protein
VRDARRVCAYVIVAATLAAAYWLTSYRETRVIEYIDRLGRHYHAPDRVAEAPWWGVYATIAVLLAGAAGLAWLYPEWRRFVRRFVAPRDIAKPS